MENLSHNFYLSENNKSENCIKYDYDQNDYLDPKNWLKKINKIYVHILFRIQVTFSGQISNYVRCLSWFGNAKRFEISFISCCLNKKVTIIKKSWNESWLGIVNVLNMGKIGKRNVVDNDIGIIYIHNTLRSDNKYVVKPTQKT